MAKKKTRDLEKTRQQILDVAFWEVYTKGFQGVSIDNIVARTDLTKGAFYHHFPTKLDLGYALVDDVLKPMILDRWINPLPNYKDPTQGILKLLQKNIGDDLKDIIQYGCPLNNLVQEMSPVDVGFKMRLQSALELWVQGMEEHLAKAQTDGILKKEIKLRPTAQFIVMGHEGILGYLKGIGDKSTFSALFDSFKIYLDGLKAE